MDPKEDISTEFGGINQKEDNRDAVLFLLLLIIIFLLIFGDYYHSVGDIDRISWRDFLPGAILITIISILSILLKKSLQ